MKRLNRNVLAFVAGLLLPAVALLPQMASAQATIDDIADAVVFTTVGPAVYATAAAVVGILVIIRGVRFVIAMVRS